MSDSDLPAVPPVAPVAAILSSRIQRRRRMVARRRIAPLDDATADTAQDSGAPADEEGPDAAGLSTVDMCATWGQVPPQGPANAEFAQREREDRAPRGGLSTYA